MGHRTWTGVATTLVSLSILVAVMVPLRTHLSVATDAMLLLVPVVIGVAMSGFVAGAVGAACGFLAYDWFFIPPYGVLRVGDSQNWVALVVYVIVVLIVARVVSVEQHARATAISREDAVNHLFIVTEQLISARPLDELLLLVAATVHQTFRTRWVAVLLPRDGSLAIAAVAGSGFSDHERELALGEFGEPQPLTLVATSSDVSRLALTTDQGPVGQLAIAGATLTIFERELLGTFANQAALAIERSQLREQVLRTRELQEADRWRNALVGAVSHDLRTPLASMKLAVSTLRDDDAALSPHDRSELLAMIEDQSDHLARLVANLLDVARIDSGALVLHREAASVSDVIAAARRSVGTALAHHQLVVTVPSDLPLVDVDLVLVAQVVANLLTNAAHHSPEGSRIDVEATETSGAVTLSVSDNGPGVAEEDRERIFAMLDRRAGSGRAGLGLTIATAFVRAHGTRLEVGAGPTGGARFFFALPVAVIDEVGR